ncbi:MAG: AAA family ATPase [Pseudomonadota bacterium]
MEPLKAKDDAVQFTRLRLNGFKSFVDPTDLVISEGLTGVVGPNGCGKSNLLEALRWVMGETRPSAMRGGGMEDVIFAGAATRNARNFAEVSLHIDNSERLAPPTLNDRDLVEVVRRITRDAGSAYRANGKEMRARDVHMLFADASTGAHSPALVRQGQISELINAKPKARRRVLEEAAGISGLYQRRHEAELKLKGTETNLSRLEDVLDQLATQLSALSRQSKQAARYREIGEALRKAEGLLLYRRWRDADAALTAARITFTEKTKVVAQTEGAARAATKSRDEAETVLPNLREEDAIASAVLQRAMVEKDTLATRIQRAQDDHDRLQARVVELEREAEREDQLSADAHRMMQSLTEEAARLAEAEADHGPALAQAETAATEAKDALQNREAAMAHVTEAVAALAARHQAMERLVHDHRKLVARETEQAARADAAVGAAKEAAETGARALEQANADAEIATSALAAAETALSQAEDQRTTAQQAEADARGVASEASGHVSALAAEVKGLERLVARDSGGGAQVLDEVRVEQGFERALGAALADDLKAPRAKGPGVSGWVELSAYDQAPALPDGVEPLAIQVTGCPLLDRRLSQVGVVDVSQGASLQPALAPGQRLVSKDGDLWRWDGLVTAANDMPSAAALRLEQQNRLATLSAELTTAQAASASANETLEAARAELKLATEAEVQVRASRKSAEAQLSAADRAKTKAEADRSLAASKADALALAADRHREAANAAQTALDQAEAEQAGLEDLTEKRAELEVQKTAVEAARVTMLSRRAAYDELKRDGEARLKRSQQISKDRKDWETRISTAAARRSDLERRQTENATALEAASEIPGQLQADASKLAETVRAADTRKTAAAEAVAVAEAALRKASEAERSAERAASDAREDSARAEALVVAAQSQTEDALARMQEALNMAPDQILAHWDVDPAQISSADALEAEVGRLRRSRDALGAVNLRAEEDAKSVQTERDDLLQEREDLEAAIAKLRGGISKLNREGRERLLTAFDEVNSNFQTLFSHLFRGGDANLVLVESDDPLDAGLEIMCQPPGKNLSTLSLLSGGEQTLTALALIFAVFLANPAPICVLDEVDAPLDDANVTRFCDMLDEMNRRTATRFLVITHHAVTMARMDRLFGVTMAEQGVSQLVSVDLKRAAAMVA